MAASLTEYASPESLESLRVEAREHTLWPEDRAVQRLLHALELTGGARHRAVSRAVALVEGARSRRDERPFLDAFLQACRTRKALHSCALPRRCCGFRTMRRRIA